MPATKRVVWDESNLRANAEYQRLHPVTMHITEPKTPYVYLDDDVVDDADAEVGGSGSARRDAARASPSTSPWLRYESSHAGEGGDADTHGGTQAQRSGEVSGGGAATSSNNNNNNDGNDDTTATTTWDPVTNAFVRELKKHIVADHSDAPRAPVSSSGRPMLAPGTVTGELAQQRHASEFVKMRRAVYADEGAKFKALLAQQRQKQQAEEDDDEDDEDDDDDDDNDDDNTARAQDRQATSASRADGKQTSEYEYPYNY